MNSWMKNTYPLFLLNVLFSVLGHPSPVAAAVVVYWNAFLNVINVLPHTGLAAVWHTQSAIPVAFFLRYGRSVTRFVPQIWMRLPRKPQVFRFEAAPSHHLKENLYFKKTTLGGIQLPISVSWNSHFNLMHQSVPPHCNTSSHFRVTYKPNLNKLNTQATSSPGLDSIFSHSKNNFPNEDPVLWEMRPKFAHHGCHSPRYSAYAIIQDRSRSCRSIESSLWVPISVQI